MNAEKKPLFERMVDAWWGKAVFGIVSFVAGYSAYSDFTKLENGEVESIWGAKFSIRLYELFGKWPPVILFILGGILLLGWGLKQMASGKE